MTGNSIILGNLHVVLMQLYASYLAMNRYQKK